MRHTGTTRKSTWRSRRDFALLGCVLCACLASFPSSEASSVADLHISQAAAQLRAARQARTAGRLEQAGELLGRVQREHPVVADHAAVLRAEVLAEAGEGAQALAVLLDTLAAHPRSSLRGRMFRALGTAKLGIGDEAGARAAWLAALRTRESAVAPELLWALAESFERDGENANAFKRYRELWLSFPTSDDAERASERLAALEIENDERTRDAEDWQERGDRLLREHHNEAALSSYDTALGLGLSRRAARRASNQRAHTLFRMRRYDEAVEAFSVLPESAEQRLWYARSLARADRVPEAIETFDALADETRGEIGLRATFLAGLLLEGRDQHDRAWAHFERVASSWRHPGLAHSALWRLAWWEFQNGQFAAALPRLERLVKHEPDPIAGLRWRYWRARCLEGLARPEAAAEFASMAAHFPFTYYGWRASFRAAPGTPDESASDRELSPGRRRLSDQQLARSRILISAGYPELARGELKKLAKRARGLRDRLELAQLLNDAGDYHTAHRIVVDAHANDLARGPTPRSEDLWWLAWPAAFGPDVEHAIAQPGTAERELVYSIMREESGYRPEVLSFSGAHGLMQIMPATAERLARDTGLTRFQADRLFEPRVNVTLGAWYLGELGKRFPQRTSATIASYNAGPRVVTGWLASDPDRLDDEWVEAIPYEQTRRYVKRVMRSLHAYHVLY